MIFERKASQLPPCLKILPALHIDIFIIRSLYHRAVIVSFGRLSSLRPTLHLDFQMFHSVIEAMVGQMLHNLFEHQICNSLAGCTMHLFLCTQNTFSLPRSHDIQAFFSNLHHSANPKDMEPSNILFISMLITFNQTSYALGHSHKQCSRDNSWRAQPAFPINSHFL